MRILVIAVSIALAGLVATWMLHHHSQVMIQQNDLRLHQQAEQLARLTADQQSLSNQLTAMGQATNGPDELASLASQAEKLRSQTNSLISQMNGNRLARASHSAPTAPHSEEYWQQLHKSAGAKPQDALQIGMGILEYASDHQGRFPSDLGQIDSYLKQNKASLSGTNQFDMVFHGTLDDLKGVPGGSVAVFRDRQTFVSPDGLPARVYGMANGTTMTITSDDDFKSWEAKHIFSPP
jgi:hypothetical protein